MPTPRPICVHCGKRYGSRLTATCTMLQNDGDPEPVPATNLRVVRKWSLNRDSSQRVWGFDLWDNETWIEPYKPFCTLRCALDFARKAFEAGFRA